MKKYLICLLLIVLLLLFVILLPSCQKEETPLADYLTVTPCETGGYYVAFDETCTAYPKQLEIPSSYGGEPIVEIAADGFCAAETQPFPFCFVIVSP